MNTIVIADRTFAALPVAVDVPGDVTHRDTRPVADETPRERVTRLAARAVIEGIQLYAHPSQPVVYATSSSRHTLYAIDTATLACSCPAQGMCKHSALYAVAQGRVDELAPAVLDCSDDDARRACRPGRCGVDACYDCKLHKATIALDAGTRTPFLCPVCARRITRRADFPAWAVEDREVVIAALNREVRLIGSARVA